MRKTINLMILSILMISLLTACVPAAATTDVENTRSMSINGSGQVSLVPDIASISIGVRTAADEVTDALSGNTDQANAISNVLRNYDVAEEDVQTSNFNVYPSDRYDPMTGEITSHYFVVENTVTVIVRDLSKLGEILSAVVEAGANSINGISFDVEDRETAVAQARELAIQDAQAKAQAIADAAGVKLGDLLSIDVYAISSPVTYYDAKGSVYSENSVPVSAGTLTITMECNLTFGLK
jgi:uncharacterized protein YggE